MQGLLQQKETGTRTCIYIYTKLLTNRFRNRRGSFQRKRVHCWLLSGVWPSVISPMLISFVAAFCVTIAIVFVIDAIKGK